MGTERTVLPAVLQAPDDVLHIVHDEVALRNLSTEFNLHPSNMRVLVGLDQGNLSEGEKKAHEAHWVRHEDVKALKKDGDAEIVYTVGATWGKKGAGERFISDVPRGATTCAASSPESSSSTCSTTSSSTRAFWRLRRQGRGKTRDR